MITQIDNFTYCIDFERNYLFIQDAPFSDSIHLTLFRAGAPNRSQVTVPRYSKVAYIMDLFSQTELDVKKSLCIVGTLLIEYSLYIDSKK